MFVRYDHGYGLTWTNSSARVREIEDVRAASCDASCMNPSGYITYLFTYDNLTPVSHLTGISNYIGATDAYSFTFYANQTLADPWSSGTNFGTTYFLQDAQYTTTLQKYHMDQPPSSGELQKVTLPNGATLRYVYADNAYTSPSDPTNTTNLERLQREVTDRYLSFNGDSGGEHHYYVERDPGDTSSGRYVHWKARMHDVDAGDAVRIWLFNYDPTTVPGWQMGLPYEYDQKHATDQALLSKQITWSQDPAGNAYMSTVKESNDQNYNPATQKMIQQTLDANGNVTQSKLFDYGNATTPLKTYNNTYLGGTYCSTYHMCDRLQQSQVTDGTHTVTIVTNTYDGVTFYNPGNLREFDTSYASNQTRGNVTTSTQPGVTTTISYDIGGSVRSTTTNGVTATVTTDPTKNFAVPSAVTTGNITLSMSWDSFLGLVTETGANSDTTSVGYDTAGRPNSVTSPYGATTTIAYTNYSSPTALASKLAVINSGLSNARFTQTTYDGLGRAIKVEIGTGSSYQGSNVVTIAQTIYAAFGSSPMGKVKQTSVSAALWTVYNYDVLGRATSIVRPDGASTTTYVYNPDAGDINAVKIMDPAGKWKKFVVNGAGDLTQVIEPDPNSSGTLVTNYTYDMLDRLTQVTMIRNGVTQTRTWVYDSTTQRLTSTTNPENGTVSYVYNSDGTLLRKTDAAGQKIEYSYDSQKRPYQVRHYVLQAGVQVEDTCQQVNFTYDSNYGDSSFQNLVGRRATATYTAGTNSGSGCTGPSITEMYGYSKAGKVAKKRM